MKTTIAAVTTPSGRGGVGIVRVSGPSALALAKAMTQKEPPIRQALHTEFFDQHGNVIDEGIILYFKGPHSFTGEDVVEFQGHGSPITLELLLQHLFFLGAVPAQPGEFSKRAFLNDKLDLLQAEAIADLIDSASVRASRLAIRNLKGAFSQSIAHFLEKLIQLRVYVEAAIDFPEEEIDFLNDGRILSHLSECIQALEILLQKAKQGVVLREGLTVVLAGLPNAGKSTLLNYLSGKESAIVTDIPGTTRDVMREQILIHGMPIHIIDTAGLRKSDDPIEQEGIRRAWKEIQEADHILLLIDIKDIERIQEIKSLILSEINPRIPVTVVINKVDSEEISPAASTTFPPFLKGGQGGFFNISAKYGHGIEELRDHLSQAAGLDTESHQEESLFMARQRHVDAIERALEHLITGKTQLMQHKAGELLAEDLRQAQKNLSEITGEFSSDDLLGKIFSSFCIGK